MVSLMNIGGLVHGDIGPYPMTGESLFFTTKLYHIDGFVDLSHTRNTAILQCQGIYIPILYEMLNPAADMLSSAVNVMNISL